MPWLHEGICGTILNAADHGAAQSKAASAGTRVWVTLDHPDDVYRKLWGKFSTETGRVENLEKNCEIFVPDGDTDDGGLYAIDILDPGTYLYIPVVNYYHLMIANLKTQGYTPGKDLHGFGYDFRQPNGSHADELVAKLEAMQAANGGRRANVCTHSMGGLVMHSFLAERPRDFERLVNKWIAIACPFLGAPGFVADTLLTGIQFAWGWQRYFFVSKDTMHHMATQAPAVYEMLPPVQPPHPLPPWDPAARPVPYPQEEPEVRVWLKRKDGSAAQEQFRLDTFPRELPTCVTKESAILTCAHGAVQEPEVHVWLKQKDGSAAQEQYGLDTFQDLLRHVLADNQVTVGGESHSMAMSQEVWDHAQQARAKRMTARLPPSCRFYNIYGTGNETAWQVTYGTQAAPVPDYAGVQTLDAAFAYVDGDCVVPACSACADGLRAEARVAVAGTHRALIEQTEVWALVQRMLQEPPAPPDSSQPVPAPLSCSPAPGSSSNRSSQEPEAARSRQQPLVSCGASQDEPAQPASSPQEPSAPCHHCRASQQSGIKMAAPPCLINCTAPAAGSPELLQSCQRPSPQQRHGSAAEQPGSQLSHGWRGWVLVPSAQSLQQEGAAQLQERS